VKITLTLDDCQFILESLEYTRKAFRETGIEPHGPYPSYGFKKQHTAEVNRVMGRVRKLRDQLKEEINENPT